MYYLKRILIAIGIVALLIIVGFSYQYVSLQKDTEQIKPSGKLFKVNNYQIHLYCTGAGSPTVLLESAAGGLSSSWGWIQPSITKKTRVCSYDHRGRGWSTGDNSTLDLEQSAKDLHAALWAAQLNDKYILVGHEMGGLYARKYHERYPEEVLGLVLVNATHPSEFVTTPQTLEQKKSSVQQLKMNATLSQIGLFRFYYAMNGSADFQTLPEKQKKEHMYFWSNPQHFMSVANENAQAETTYIQAQKLSNVDSLPVRIISAADLTEEAERLQNDLFTISKDSSRITIPDSTNTSLVFKKEHAERVSTVILNLVESLSK